MRKFSSAFSWQAATLGNNIWLETSWLQITWRNWKFIFKSNK